MRDIVHFYPHPLHGSPKTWSEPLVHSTFWEPMLYATRDVGVDAIQNPQCTQSILLPVYFVPAYCHVKMFVTNATAVETREAISICRGLRFSLCFFVLLILWLQVLDMKIRCI